MRRLDAVRPRGSSRSDGADRGAPRSGDPRDDVDLADGPVRSAGRDIYPIGRIGSGYLQALDLTDPAVTATFEQRIEGLLGYRDRRVQGRSRRRGRPRRARARRRERQRRPQRVPGPRREGDRRCNGGGAREAAADPVSRGVHGLAVARHGDLVGRPAREPGTASPTAVRSAQTAGLVGFSTWGSDIGGYESPDLTADVFVRWAQLGAISPVFEVGGTGRTHAPGSSAQRRWTGSASAAVLHQELFPDLYQLARARAGPVSPCSARSVSSTRATRMPGLRRRSSSSAPTSSRRR